MNKKFEPFLAHSELTDCIYIIDKDDKYEVTEQCIKAMKATNRMPKWIPVSERLPEEDGEYLVSIEGNITHKMIVDIAHWYKSEKANNGFYKANEVFAWMPLPEPYKEDDNGE